jgi:hypothetical protein
MTINENFKWIAVGKRKHNHSPDPDVSPDTPNGFPRGPISDLRIYRRTLTTNEVYAVFTGQSTGGGGGGGGSSTNSTTTLSGRLTLKGQVQIK